MKEGVNINIGILGTGRCLPKKTLTNFDLEKMVDTSDEWITSRTGIKQRGIAEDELTSDLAIDAAKRALEYAGISGEAIDIIIVATMTPDHFTPSMACLVQKGVGAESAACFDLSAACSGFVYALSTAYKFLGSGVYKNALVIGSETLSKIVDWEDRNTCVLFGDGAAAAVIGHKEGARLVDEILGADGAKGHLLTCQALNHNKTQDFLKMDGREVYKFATRTVVGNVKAIVEKADLTVEDIDHVVLHQANYRIIETVMKKLKIPKEKIYVNLDKYGNTSSASIPIALDEMVRNNQIKPGDKVILSGFGGGLTWGTVLIEW